MFRTYSPERIAYVLSILCLLLSACSEVAPTNPFDPDTPVSQQAKARVMGTASLPASESDYAVFESGRAALIDQRFAAGSVIKDCQSEQQSWIVENATAYSVLDLVPGTGAEFLMTEVPADTYDLVLCVRGYQPIIVVGLNLERGGDEQFDFVLEAVRAALQTATIAGRVQLEGAPENGHGQVLISTVGRPYSATTTETGAFNLQVPGGTYTVSAYREGYSRDVLTDVVVTGTGTTTLERELTLMKDRSGRVVGQLLADLPQHMWSDTTVVRLIGDAQTRTEIPNVDGGFEFSDLALGLYGLEVSSLGHQPVARIVDVASGETSLAPIELVSDARTQDVVYLRGRVFLDDQLTLEGSANHSGVFVQTLVNNEVVASTLTDSDGGFAVPASRANYLLRFQKAKYDDLNIDVTWSRAANQFVANGQALADVNDIVLIGEPGTLRGRIHLAQFTDPVRLQQMDLSLQSTQGEAVWRSSPDAVGVFSFPNVKSGLYRLQGTLTGFESFSREVHIPVGNILEINSIGVEHNSNTDAAVAFRGRVLLDDSDDHSDTVIRLDFASSNQVFQTLTTGVDGRFLVQAAPEEALKVIILRPNYDTPDSDSLGRFTYNEAQLNFQNEAGEALAQTLTRHPLNGELMVGVDVGPDWLPSEQRHVAISVTQLDGNYRATRQSVNDMDVAGFSGLPAGLYSVVLSRSGFETVTLPTVRLTNEEPMQTLDHTSVNLSRLADANIDLEGQRIDTCDLRSIFVDLTEADFSGVTFVGEFGPLSEETECVPCSTFSPPSEMCDALNFQGADFTNAIFDVTGGASLKAAQLRQANFFGAQLDDLDMSNAELSFTNFFGASANGANLANTKLNNANFTSASLIGAKFVLVDGVHQETMQLSEDGSEELQPHPWAGLNKPTRSLPAKPCEHSEQNGQLDGASFAQANLAHSVMFGIDLSRATLANTLLTGSDLRHVCLSGVSLNLTDFSEAVLDGADMQGARLINSVLYETELRGVDLRASTMTSAVIELARFDPMPALEDDGVVDGTCSVLPTWSDYYPIASNPTERTANCDDGIDNDGDGFTDTDDPGCGLAEGASEAAPACANHGELSEQCRCRTLISDSNLNGANLVGALFDGSDLTRTTLLGVSIGNSRGFPRRPPSSCDQQRVEACIGFCVNGQQLNDPCEQGVDFGFDVSGDCLGTWAQGCRENRLSEIEGTNLDGEVQLTSELTACLYAQYTESAALCPSYAETELSIYGSCVALIYGDAESIPGAAPRVDAPNARCTQGALKRTWSLNQLGETCTDSPEFDEDASIWHCCPEAYVDPDCSIASTSFVGARLDSSEQSAVVINAAELQGSTLRNAQMEALTLVNSRLDESKLTDANLRGGRIVDSSFVGSDLSGVAFVNSTLTNVDLSNADLSSADFRGASITDAIFDGVFVEQASSGIDLTDAHISSRSVHPQRNVKLPGTLFDRANIDSMAFLGVDFSKSTIANSVFRRILLGYDSLGSLGISLSIIDGLVVTDSDVEGLHVNGVTDQLMPITDVALYNLSILRNRGGPVLNNRENRLANLELTEFLGDRTEVEALSLYEVSGSAVFLVDSQMTDVDWSGGLLEGSSCVRSGIQFDNVTAVDFLNIDFDQCALQIATAQEVSIRSSRAKELMLNIESGYQVTIADLEVLRLEMSGSLTDSQVSDIVIGFRVPRIGDSSLECSSFKRGGICGEDKRCIDGQCFPVCDSEADCGVDEVCEQRACRPVLGVATRSSLVFRGDMVGEQIFSHISGDRMVVGDGELDGELSHLTLSDLLLTNVEFAPGQEQQAHLRDSTISRFSVSDSDFGQLRLTNVTVTQSTSMSNTSFEYSVFDGLTNLPRPRLIVDYLPIEGNASEVCGSRLKLNLSDGDPVNLAGSDLRGVCDMPAYWHGADLDGAQVCGQDENDAGITGITGTPNWSDCPVVLCPDATQCATIGD